MTTLAPRSTTTSPLPKAAPTPSATTTASAHHHHHLKTHKGHELVGEPGQRSWLDADGNVLSRDPPPDTDPDPP